MRQKREHASAINTIWVVQSPWLEKYFAFTGRRIAHARHA
jgi:hypothetical protein